jgi:PST family polysaccharide transporter
MGIRRKMAKGAFWLFLEKGTQQVLSFIVFTVIATLIGPKEYGLVAMCTVIISLVNNMILGLVDSIVSMKIRDDERLSSLFWFVLAIGVIISALSFFMAGYFASFFNEEKLKPLLQVFTIIPILYGLAAVPIGLITASMNFRIFTIRAFIASLLGGGVGVYLAYDGWGAYAIAIQQIVVQLSTVVILFISHSWRPKLIFNIRILKDLIYIGVGQTSSLIVSFIEHHVPRLILGYFISPAAVGHYAFVQRVLAVLQEGIVQPIVHVVFPAITAILDKPEEKRVVIQQTVYILGSILFPIVIGIILTANLFVPLLFGDKWAKSTVLMQIYAPAVIFISFNLFMKSILRAHQLIYMLLRIQAIIALLSTICVFLVAPSGGVVWVLTVQIVASVLSTISFSTLLSLQLNISIWRDYLSLLFPALSSLAMIGPVWLIHVHGVLGENNPINLPFSMVVGMITYIIILSIFERKRLQKAISYIQGINGG